MFFAPLPSRNATLKAKSRGTPSDRPPTGRPFREVRKIATIRSSGGVRIVLLVKLIVSSTSPSKRGGSHGRKVPCESHIDCRSRRATRDHWKGRTVEIRRCRGCRSRRADHRPNRLACRRSSDPEQGCYGSRECCGQPRLSQGGWRW